MPENVGSIKTRSAKMKSRRIKFCKQNTAMLYDQHCSTLHAEFNMFTKSAYLRGYETSGEEKIKLYFCLLTSSRDSRKMPRSLRLAHNATVMRARY